MTDPKKILIIQTAFIGDVVLALPMLKVIKEKYPSASVDFLCIPSTAILLKNNPYVSEVIVYDKRNSGVAGLFRLSKKLKAAKYDVIISPHRSFRSAFITKIASAGRTISFDRSSFSFLYDEKIIYKESYHEIIRNLKLLSSLGITVTNIVRPELFPGNEEVIKIDKILSDNNYSGNRIIAIAPGSVWFTKRYPVEKFVNVCDRLKDFDRTIILSGSIQDKQTCDFIQQNSLNKNLINTAGALTMLETAELIKRSSVLITNDSAPLHVSNAVGARVVALFGSTIPEFGFYPYNEDDIILEIEGLACRPCTTHGRQSCPIKTFLCMNKITEESVTESAVKF